MQKKFTYLTLIPEGTKISELPPTVALTRGQKLGPDRILGPTRLIPVTKMSFRQFSAVSWVQRCPSTHQSHGNGDATQEVHDENVLQSEIIKRKIIVNSEWKSTFNTTLLY